jgi:maltooligosyltrehalose trehalohydrolase
MEIATVSHPNGIELARSSLGAVPRAGESVCWRVWAPRAKKVELALFVAGPSAEPGIIPMKPEPGGFFVHTEHDVHEGLRYAYRLDGGPDRPDPASRWQPEGVHHPSAVIRLDRFDWSEGDWAGLPLEELVIYELHVGTFAEEGTFDAVIPRLEELRELGITAIELMPVAQFPDSHDWGYDAVHPYAAQNTYGGPRGLQRLVNACHRTGLAVIFDVIYNHFGPEGSYFAEFGPYFTERYRTPWGSAINYDARGSDGVRAFVLDNVRFWIREYHADALRLDAVHAIYDFSPRHILCDIQEEARHEARQLGREVLVIAESDLNDVRLLDPPERGGYGLDAQWSDDFHHSVHSLLTGERSTYYADFGKPEQIVKALNQSFVFDGVYSPFRGRRHGGPVGSHPCDRFVISIQNHDQTGNRPGGDRIGTLLEPNQQRLAAGLLLLAPQIPLIFMGEEYGETRPFPFFCSFTDPQVALGATRGRIREFAERGVTGEVFDPQAEETFESARLSWSWPAGSQRAGLRRLYYDLLAIRRFWVPLRDTHEHTADLLESWAESSPILRLVRTAVSNLTSLELVALFNLSAQPQPVPDSERRGRLLIASDAVTFGGTRGPTDPLDTLRPFEFWVFGPEHWGGT